MWLFSFLCDCPSFMRDNLGFSLMTHFPRKVFLIKKNRLSTFTTYDFFIKSQMWIYSALATFYAGANYLSPALHHL